MLASRELGRSSSGISRVFSGFLSALRFQLAYYNTIIPLDPNNAYSVIYFIFFFKLHIQFEKE